jgi:hypothetical protein
LAVTACGAGATKPLAASVTPTPTPSVAPDLAVKAAVNAYIGATNRSPNTTTATTFSGVATPAWASTLIARYRANIAAHGKALLGTSKVASATSQVAGDTATVDVCEDDTGVYVVPKGATTIDPAEATPGSRLRDTFHLVLRDGRWLVDSVSSKGEQC